MLAAHARQFAELDRAMRPRRSNWLLRGAMVATLLGWSSMTTYCGDDQEHHHLHAEQDAALLAPRAAEFRAREGRCPYSDRELIAAGFMTRRLIDPWHRDFVFECTGAWTQACSRGPDPVSRLDDICAALAYEQPASSTSARF